MKESFVFYKSFYDSIRRIKNKELKSDIFEAICELALYNNDIELTSEVGLMIMDLIKPQIEANNKRYEDGKKGGRPKKKTSGYEKEKTSGYENKKPNDNVNENDNVNVNANENVINNISATVLNKKNIEAEEIIARLNELAGTNFRAEGKATKKLIDDLLKDYTKEEVLYVVEKMCYIWGQTKQSDKDMSVYLRPSTLFRKSNFENYLGMKVPEKKITTEDLGQYYDFSEFR